MTIKTRCQDIEELDEMTQSVYYGFPMLLNLEFADPPVISRVTGQVGKTAFSWELSACQTGVDVTTQEKQEKRVIDSWCRFDVIEKPPQRRLLAALHYFHIACRLMRAGHTPWEFLGESILNFCKVLEVLFPGAEGGSCDSAREGLRKLGYEREEIERDFVPAILLRNQIDVGHVFLSVLTREQLNIVHMYSASAEQAFRKMLRTLMENVREGKFEVPPYEVSPVGSDIARTLEAMAVEQRQSPLYQAYCGPHAG